MDRRRIAVSAPDDAELVHEREQRGKGARTRDAARRQARGRGAQAVERWNESQRDAFREDAAKKRKRVDEDEKRVDEERIRMLADAEVARRLAEDAS
jgi:hypothetical protein